MLHPRDADAASLAAWLERGTERRQAAGEVIDLKGLQRIPGLVDRLGGMPSPGPGRPVLHVA
jgi:predicted glycosyltransferase